MGETDMNILTSGLRFPKPERINKKRKKKAWTGPPRNKMIDADDEDRKVEKK